MSFEPEFMKSYDKFNQEKLNIKTESDWIAFRKKWFPTKTWPEKSAKQLTSESQSKKEKLKRIDEKTWGCSTYMLDITPEARYEMFSAIYTIGLPLQFPVSLDTPKTSENGWTLKCPYCEIWTNELDFETCPICKRELIYSLSPE